MIEYLFLITLWLILIMGGILVSYAVMLAAGALTEWRRAKSSNPDGRFWE